MCTYTAQSTTSVVENAFPLMGFAVASFDSMLCLIVMLFVYFHCVYKQLHYLLGNLGRQSTLGH